MTQQAYLYEDRCSFRGLNPALSKKTEFNLLDSIHRIYVEVNFIFIDGLPGLGVLSVLRGLPLFLTTPR
jgi:hypothetical protein